MLTHTAAVYTGDKPVAHSPSTNRLNALAVAAAAAAAAAAVV